MKKLALCTFTLLTCLFASRLAIASIALVQVAPILQTGSTQTNTITFSTHVTAGHAILVLFGQTISASGAPPAATVSDGTDTYVQIRNDTVGSAFGTQMWLQSWSSNNITASTTITINLDAGSGFIIDWGVAFEVSGQNKTALLDNIGATGFNGSPATFTTVAANTMVIGGVQASGAFSASWSPNAGFTTVASTSAGAPAGVLYALETSAGSVSPGFTLNTADFSFIGAFSIAGASAPAASPAIFFTSSN
jgi:hypothetical protein